jgi:CRP-like cAMP-binding protein
MPSATRPVYELVTGTVKLDRVPEFQRLHRDELLPLPIDVALTQAQLAARLGTVRELIARALSQLEKAGIIARDRSRIIIRDPARLAALARGDQETAPGADRVT